MDNKYGGQWLEQQMDKMIAGTIEIVDLLQVCKFLGMVNVQMNGLSSLKHRDLSSGSYSMFR